MKLTKWISLILVLCMVQCMIPVPASAATLSGYCGDNVRYSFNESTGKMVISGTGDMKSVTNSTEPYNNYWDMQEIAQDILSVEIQSGVTSIGAGSFFFCTNLSSVTIADTVTKIGKDAFYNADSLHSITLPSGLTEIGANAFASSGLREVVIPAGVKQIPDRAFSGCALESVVFRGTMTRIGVEAFYNCNSLTSVSFEAGMDSGELDEQAFAYCEELADLVLPEGLVRIGARAFEGDDKYGAEVVIPETVESIWDSAFRECNAMTTVTIPEKVSYIGANPFIFCDGLENATMYSQTVDKLKQVLFSGCDKLEYVHIIGDEPTTEREVFGSQSDFFLVYYDRGTAGWEGSTWNGYLIQAWGEETPVRTGQCGENVTWELDGGILTISGEGPTYDYDGSVENGPGWVAFKDYINEVVIEEGVTTVGQNLFSQPGGMTTNNYPYLTSVSIPSTVTTIGDWAFEYCLKLKKVQLSEGLQSIGLYAFHDCQSLSDIALPSTVVSIKDSAFQGALSGVSLVIPAGVTEIAGFTFYQADLIAITFPENLTAIKSAAFDSCWNLAEMTFTGAAPEINSGAFANVTATAYYPDGASWTEDVLQDYGGDITWISTHTHSYTPSVIAPTCTGQGYTVHTCECGDSYKDTYVDALGHDFGKAVFDKTTKSHVRECVVCGEKVSESCTFDKGTLVKEATMESFGIIKYTCTVCGGSYEVETAYRVFGAGRSETAIAAAEELKEVLGVEKFDTIILASGEGFADALAGSYLAVKKDAPILLVQKSTIELNKNYISENLAQGGTVYILGGLAAVPQEMEDALKDLNVKRLQGADRYETNLMILEEAGIEDEEILICTGWNFADSLSASATGLPILMLNTAKNVLTEDQEEFLEAYADNEFTIIGGTAAVSEKLETAVEAVVGEVGRVFGESREQTSVEVAKRYFSVPDYAVIAYSRNFPDGLCGGPLAHALKAPLLLVSPKQETAAAEYVKTQGIAKGFVLGGTAAVTEDSARIVFGIK